MRTRLLMVLAGSLFLLPALAQADIYNRRPLTRSRQDMSLRKLIAKRLNHMPRDQTGRGPKAKFLPTKVNGDVSFHPGAFGTQVSVRFTAQPRYRLRINGSKKRQTVYIGGCGGNCGILRPVQGRDRITDINITGLLRSGPPQPAAR